MTTVELFLSLVAALGALSVFAFLYCIHQLFKDQWQAAEDHAKQRRKAHAEWKARLAQLDKERP